MKRVFIIAGMVTFLEMFLILGIALAFNPEHVQKLRTTNQCINCDLSGAILSETKLNWATWTDGLKCKPLSIGKCVK